MNDYILYYDFNNVRNKEYVLKVDQSEFYKFSMMFGTIIKLNHFTRDIGFPIDYDYYVIKLEDDYINMIRNKNVDDLTYKLTFEIFKVKLNEIT